MPELRITSAKEWRKLRADGVVIQLPSGFVARVRPVGLMELWKLDKIPDSLTGIVVELLTAQRVDPDTAVKKALESMRAITALYDVVCMSAFLEPRVVMNNPGPDEIAVDDIDLADKEFLLAFVNGPTAALQPFRQEQESGVEPVRDRQELRPAPVPAPGSS